MTLSLTAFLKAMTDMVFGTKFKVVRIFSFTVEGFSNKREYSGADWLDPLISKFLVAFALLSSPLFIETLCWNCYEYVNMYMGQKDQDGDYAEKCHIFFKFAVGMHQPKNSPSQK